MSDNHVLYEKDYLPFIIKWGRITNWTALLLCFSPALVLTVVFGLMPPASAIISGFLAITSAVGVIWFVEPISYFPIVGVAGTYMAFVSSNISKLRIPCAMIAQKAAGVEPGTDKGSIVATLGMAVSIIVNVVILAAGSFAGAQVLQQQPEFVVKALQLLLPLCFVRSSCGLLCPSHCVRSVSAPCHWRGQGLHSRFCLDGYRGFREHCYCNLFLQKNIIK